MSRITALHGEGIPRPHAPRHGHGRPSELRPCGISQAVHLSERPSGRPCLDGTRTRLPFLPAEASCLWPSVSCLSCLRGWDRSAWRASGLWRRARPQLTGHSGSETNLLLPPPTPACVSLSQSPAPGMPRGSWGPVPRFVPSSACGRGGRGPRALGPSTPPPGPGGWDHLPRSLCCRRGRR